MAVPTNALVWPDPMDPSDVVDYVVDTSGMLDSNELVQSFTVVPYAEAALLGLSIGTGIRQPSLVDDSRIRIWLSVAPAYLENVAFSGSGATLPIQLTVQTSSVPSRTRQRTLVVKVQQQ